MINQEFSLHDRNNTISLVWSMVPYTLFQKSVSLSIPLGPFRIFRKFAEIFAAQGAPRHRWQMEKSSTRKVLINFFDTFEWYS
jgi:hypothetical protein